MYAITLSEGSFCPVIISTLSCSFFNVVRTGNVITTLVGMNWNLFFVQNPHLAMLFVQYLN